MAAWILVSGLDDLFITLVHLLQSRRRFDRPSRRALRRKSQRPIAIFIPLWQEDGVIEQMLERNLASIDYHNYHIFAGVYPNDTATLTAVERVARRHPRLHMAVCPHNGPTSKGDCLNWTWRRMQEYEEARGIRFRIIMTHDAEDVVHPKSLRTINWYSRDHEMVQIPVLPLPTPAVEWTHGLYCDEFAEYQTKDIPVRQTLGGFIPANGVGTGFAREALEQLADKRGGQPFDPACLTEDYETGFELHSMGYRQIFVPLSSDLVATREYFPRRAKSCVRQRCRWVTGIALQGWERHGWDADWRQRYWFWRDRKGVIGNLLTPLSNVFMIYTLARSSHLNYALPVWFWTSCFINMFITMLQMGMRARSASQIYGWRFASVVPLRVLWANLINCAATARALAEYIAARASGAQLKWKKTEHTYPISLESESEPDPIPDPPTAISSPGGAHSSVQYE